MFISWDQMQLVLHISELHKLSTSKWFTYYLIFHKFHIWFFIYFIFDYLYISYLIIYIFNIWLFIYFIFDYLYISDLIIYIFHIWLLIYFIVDYLYISYLIIDIFHSWLFICPLYFFNGVFCSPMFARLIWIFIYQLFRRLFSFFKENIYFLFFIHHFTKR